LPWAAHFLALPFQIPSTVEAHFSSHPPFAGLSKIC
jgi:hypothetical protein